MKIDTAGDYILRYTATDSCGKSASVDRDIVVNPAPYGVEWDGTSRSVWTRIGSSAGIGVANPAKANGTGSSPYDNIMPWSGMQIVEDANAGTLVSIPKYYYKWTRDGIKMRLEISPTPIEGFFTSPAHADRGDGVGERDVVYVGRYHCADDFKSKTGAAPLVSTSITDFRTGIHALGSDIWQYDFAMYWTIAMLYLVEFFSWDSQVRIGYGCTANGQIEVNGITDAMQYHTGTSASSRGTYGQIQYRNIEGLWSNSFDWVDGIRLDGIHVYVTKNPSEFSNYDGGVFIGDTISGSTNVATSFLVPPQGYEYALFPNAYSTSGSYDDYTCDQFYSNTIERAMFVGGGSDKSKGSGLFSIRVHSTPIVKIGDVGARLMKLPSA